MKVIMLFITLGFFLDSSRAQNCDVAQTGLAIYDAANTKPIASIATGQDANFRFSIANFGTDPGCSIPANSVTAIFNFPASTGGLMPYIYDGPAQFVSGYFSWTYSSMDNVLQGTNTKPIPNGQGDANILVRVKGNAAGTEISNLKLVQANSISDNSSNNLSGAQLIVTKGVALTVDLSAFTVTADKCDALLKWSTSSSEANFSHFDIEYSADGRTFTKLGTEPGKNSVTGADYKYTYTQPNGDGYYRLKQVNKDGRFEYSSMMQVTTSCKDKNKVAVHPNPLHYDQKLVVTASGFTGKIKGELFNAAGQKVNVYNLINSVNELSVMNLTAGVYMLNVKSEQGDIQSFKIVVTR